MIDNIIIWIILWSLGWLGFLLLNRKGIDYINKFYISMIYFLSLSILVLAIYWKDFSELVKIEFSIIPFLFVPLLLIINILTYNYIRNNLTKPSKLINENPQLFFLKLDNKYLASKFFEILFQQILIVLLIIWLSKLEFSILGIIVYFTVLFGLGHLYLIYSIGKLFGTIFTIASIFSAIIFPILIVYVPWGFIYSYFIHWMFYISAGLFFWKREHQKRKLGLGYTVGRFVPSFALGLITRIIRNQNLD